MTHVVHVSSVAMVSFCVMGSIVCLMRYPTRRSPNAGAEGAQPDERLAAADVRPRVVYGPSFLLGYPPRTSRCCFLGAGVARSRRRPRSDDIRLHPLALDVRWAAGDDRPTSIPRTCQRAASQSHVLLDEASTFTWSSGRRSHPRSRGDRCWMPLVGRRAQQPGVSRSRARSRAAAPRRAQHAAGRASSLRSAGSAEASPMASPPWCPTPPRRRAGFRTRSTNASRPSGVGDTGLTRCRALSS